MSAPANHSYMPSSEVFEGMESQEGIGTLVIRDIVGVAVGGTLLLAEDERDGAEVPVNSSEVDKRRDYLVCPTCRDRVFRVKKTSAWHFRHEVRDSSEKAKCGTGEGLLHFAAKNFFKVGREFTLPELKEQRTVKNPAYIPGSKEEKMNTEEIEFTFTYDWSTESWTNGDVPNKFQIINQSRLECLKEGFRPDVIVICSSEKDSFKELLIEVCVSHHVDESKRTLIKSKGYSAIEIFISKPDLKKYLDSDFSDYVENFGKEKLWAVLEDFVLLHSSRNWISKNIGESAYKVIDAAINKELEVRKNILKDFISEKEMKQKNQRRDDARKIIDAQNNYVDFSDLKPFNIDKYIAPFVCVLRDVRFDSNKKLNTQALLNYEIGFLDVFILDALYGRSIAQPAAAVAMCLIDDGIAKEGTSLPNGWEWSFVEEHLKDDETVNPAVELSDLVSARLLYLGGLEKPLVVKSCVVDSHVWELSSDVKEYVAEILNNNPLSVLDNMPVDYLFCFNGKKVNWEYYAALSDAERKLFSFSVKLFENNWNSRDKIENIDAIIKDGWSIVRLSNGEDVVQELRNSNDKTFNASRLALEKRLMDVSDRISALIVSFQFPQLFIGQKDFCFPFECERIESKRNFYLVRLKSSIEDASQYEKILASIEVNVKKIFDLHSFLESAPNIIYGINIPVDVDVVNYLKKVIAGEFKDASIVSRSLYAFFIRLNDLINLSKYIKHLCETRQNPATIIMSSVSEGKDVMKSPDDLPRFVNYPAMVQNMNTEAVHRRNLRDTFGVDINAWISANSDNLLCAFHV